MRIHPLIPLGALLLSSAVAVTAACQSMGGSGTKPIDYTRYSGEELIRPEGYRKWVFVGEPVTPNDMNNGKAAFPEFHSVYIDPDSFDHYSSTGEFRDGTILVKELISVGSKQAVSGNGYFMGEFIGLEATVKDSKRFANQPGNWAYFSFTDPDGGEPAATAEAFPTASCNACHDASAQDDFVFTQYYPVLRDAKGQGIAQAPREPFTMDNSGNLLRPEGYRKWVFVGEPVTPNDMNNGKAAFPEMHSVYIDPASYDHYSRTGEFRDGTILVKELVSVGSKQAVSGNGYFMGDFIGLEATIKSSKYFPNEPGNWAYFSFTDPDGGKPAPTAEAFPTASCNACHDASAQDDFVFTQYYPVLSEASGKRKSMSSSAKKAPDKWQPTSNTPTGVRGGVPLDKDRLFDFLSAGHYKSFPSKEAKTHPGRGPHTKVTAPVRVFYNDSLSTSLSAGNAEHPEGAAAVKEMFDDDGDLAGWAVMAKTQAASDDGRGWFWYEVTSRTDSNAIAAMGNGVPGCVSCHSFRDKDMILSGYPLK